MPKFNKNYEDQMLKAIDALNTQKPPNIAKTAREYGVKWQTLSVRWKGRSNLLEWPPTNTRLSKEQEKALCHYIDTLEQLNVKPLARMIQSSANSILKSTHTNLDTPPPTVSEKWLNRWLGRHPEYKKRRSRAIELDRKRAEDHEVIQEWFQKLHRTIQNHGILKEDIYNFDETGFNIGVGRDQWIITRDFNTKKPHIGMNSNREYVTVVEAVNTDGWTCPPLILMSGSCILANWFEATDIQQEYSIGVSENGYMTDMIAFQWIQSFYRHTKRYRKGQYTLLICDGYGSHLTHEFVEFCEKTNIITFFLPPHTSHFLQPLDVGVFHAYKHWHSEAVADATYSGCGKFTKVEFLHALGAIRKKTFKQRTIQHGFQKTGIVPFNPSIVLDQMPQPDYPSSSSTSNNNDVDSWGSTPKKANRFREIGDRISEIHDTDEDEFNKGLELLIRGGSMLASYSAAIEAELDQYIKAARDRAARSQASRRRIRKGGIVSSSELEAIKRNTANINEQAEIKRWRAKYKHCLPELLDVCIQRGIIIRRQRRARAQAEE